MKQSKVKGEEKFVVQPFFVAINITKLKLFYFLTGKEKTLSQFTKNHRTFTQKIATTLSKIWFWDPGSETRDPGVKNSPDPGSAISCSDF
jgi:hypothetical protein